MLQSLANVSSCHLADNATAPTFVPYWPKSDMDECTANVCFRGVKRTCRFALRMPGNDPKADIEGWLRIISSESTGAKPVMPAHGRAVTFAGPQSSVHEESARWIPTIAATPQGQHRLMPSGPGRLDRSPSRRRRVRNAVPSACTSLTRIQRLTDC